MTTFEVLTLVLIAVTGIIVPYVASLKKDISDHKKEINKFQLDVAKNYVTNNDMKEHVSTHLKSIEDQISTIKSMLSKQNAA